MVTSSFTFISDHEHLKIAHGIINVMSYGMLMLLGVMFACYLLGWDGWILGVVGFGMGLQLQTYTPVLLYHKHQDLGVTIFLFTTLQVFLDINHGDFCNSGSKASS